MTNLTIKKYTVLSTLIGLTFFVYGLFSSSTPSYITIAEVVIGFCLVIFMLMQLSLYYEKSIFLSKTSRFLKWSFFYFFFVISLFGFANGASAIEVFRDIVPILYLFLFFFMLPTIYTYHAECLKIIPAGLLFVGCAFSLRYFLIEGVEISKLGSSMMFGDMSYFPLDPAVTFGAVYALVEGFRLYSCNSYIKSLLYLWASTICVASLVGMVIRAPLILYMLVLIFLVLFHFKRISKLSLFIIFFIVLFFEKLPLLDIYNIIFEKFWVAGMNAKDEEIIMVFNEIAREPKIFFIGAGWGAYSFSPAVGGEVRFFHNFMLYFLFKSGVLGLIFSVWVIFRFYFIPGFLFLMNIYRGCSVFLKDNSLSVFFGALVALSSSFFLQPNFKSLSFGFLLVLVFSITRFPCAFNSRFKINF